MATISKEKLDLAIKNALAKVDKMTEKFTDCFPSSSSKGGIYEKSGNTGGWTQCFYTGMLVLAYQMTKDEKYINLAKELDKTFFNRVNEVRLKSKTLSPANTRRSSSILSSLTANSISFTAPRRVSFDIVPSSRTVTFCFLHFAQA